MSLVLKTVTMCVCHNTSFSELKHISDKYGFQSVQELIENGYCGSGCSMCEPYVSKMLVTGQTAFAPGDCFQTKEL